MKRVRTTRPADAEAMAGMRKKVTGKVPAPNGYGSYAEFRKAIEPELAAKRPPVIGPEDQSVFLNRRTVGGPPKTPGFVPVLPGAGKVQGVPLRVGRCAARPAQKTLTRRKCNRKSG